MTLTSFIPLMMGLRGWQFIIVILVVLLLFGGKKIPELMRGLGKGLGSFRQGLDEAKNEYEKTRREYDKAADNDTGRTADDSKGDRKAN